MNPRQSTGLGYKRVVSCKDSFHTTDLLAVSEHAPRLLRSDGDAGGDRGESDIERAVRGTERVMHDVAGRWLDVTWNARPATARDTPPAPPSPPVARFPNCLRPCLRCSRLGVA